MPYSWDNDNDFDPASSSGYSFTDARRSYDDVAVAQKLGKAVHTFRSPRLQTDAEYPIVVGIDTTGSMQEWPRVFFDKLPLLYKEAVRYLPSCAMSFQAINDFHADGPDVALQPAPFGRGPQLEEHIGQLYAVGGGGGQVTESYEIFALYNSLLEAPKALIKPLAIILGDEAPFDHVPREVVAHLGMGDEEMPSRNAFARLVAKCDVFLVRKPYNEEHDPLIVSKWRRLGIAGERIMLIDDPRRVVDVILGILGVVTGKFEMFEGELRSRQEPAQVRSVMSALGPLKASFHADPASLGHSRSRGLGAGSPRSKRIKTDD